MILLWDFDCTQILHCLHPVYNFDQKIKIGPSWLSYFEFWITDNLPVCVRVQLQGINHLGSTYVKFLVSCILPYCTWGSATTNFKLSIHPDWRAVIIYIQYDIMLTETSVSMGIWRSEQNWAITDCQSRIHVFCVKFNLIIFKICMPVRLICLNHSVTCLFFLCGVKL